MKALLRQCFFISIITEDFALKRTTNYALPTWEKSDFIQMSDFNDLTHKLDAALKQTADTADEVSRTAATAESVTAIARDLGTHGKNARIAWGSYTGDGRYGRENPNSLNFDFKPVMLTVGSDNESAYPGAFLVRPVEQGVAAAGGRVHVTWGERSVSWYTLETTNPHIYQSNRSGYVYHYLAIGYDE